MDQIESIIVHADLMYKLAYIKTNDINDAEDLVQETYLNILKAIHNGIVINDMKSYLVKVLNNTFYYMLRKRNKQLMISNTELIFDVHKDENSELEATNNEALNEEATKTIRSKLSYLSKIYREVMVQFYMESKSINDIAKNLNISKGTVMSRLDTGRKLLKEGINNMKTNTVYSYNPNKLKLFFLGDNCPDEEPIIMNSNMIEQNILISAYEKPVTATELGEALGVATTYIEEFIDKLVKHEFLKRVKNKVFTNFLLVDDEILANTYQAQKEFVENTYQQAHTIFEEIVDEYKKTGVLCKFNDVQLYLYGLCTIFQYVRHSLKSSLKLIEIDDYPSRYNGGRWIIYAGYKIDNNESKRLFPNLIKSGSFITKNSTKLAVIEWKTNLSETNIEKFNLPIIYKINLLYSFYKGETIDIKSMQLVPELIKLGYLYNDKTNTKMVNIPIISESDFSKISKINKHFQTKFIDSLGDVLIKMVKENKLKYPKLISPVSCGTHLICIDKLVLLYMFKLAEKNVIKIEENKNYPVSIIIEMNN